jgi:hypothetical protein
MKIGPFKIAREIGIGWGGKPPRIRIHYCAWERVRGKMLKFISPWFCIRITYLWYERH